MEEKVVVILNEMSEYLSVPQMKKLQEVMIRVFSERTEEKRTIPNETYLKMFLDAKAIEGCSDRTLQYYRTTIDKMLSRQIKPVRKITTEDNVLDLNRVREALRDLLQYIEKGGQKPYYVDFTDEITEPVEGEPISSDIGMENYKKKVEFYLKAHEDNISVFKLRNNKRLTAQDLGELERILWKELGTKDDYIKEYGDKPVGRLVRQIVGVDRSAVNEAFSRFLSDEHLNVNQIRFVNLIIDYIVANGNIEDNSALQQEPFKSVGSITVLFKDDMNTAREIINTIEQIKENSERMA